MSQAFVKEEDGDPERLPDRPQSSSPNYITPAGERALRERVEAFARRKAALAEKDEESRKEADRDLRYLQERLARAIVVDNAGLSVPEARFGARVEFEEAGSRRAVRLVGEDEADEEAGRVPWASALGLVLLGAAAGDRVPWGDGDGLRVVSVSYPGDEAID